ncbi:hypothetical protein ACIRPQ_21300 [Streptomyces sp. NPDC101213]|uniref:hypothetical protein n=1 Tax=Streptomyces sp. NPDC101213 TaxID=3366130 RepID=UPI0037F9C84C
MCGAAQQGGPADARDHGLAEGPQGPTAFDEAACPAVGQDRQRPFQAGEVILYAYGPHADARFAVMAPLLNGLPLRPAYVALRYGSVDDLSTAEHRVDL